MQCPLCKNEQDTQEHLGTCENLDDLNNDTAIHLEKKITERNTNPPNSQCSDGAHTLLGTV